jgi:hypothetical protein
MEPRYFGEEERFPRKLIATSIDNQFCGYAA